MKLLEQILQVARKNADKIAFTERTSSYTYRDLFAAVAELKAEIEKRRLSERPIVLFGKNDFRTLAGMLAVNLTGRAYIPIDAHTPLERTQMILGAAKPSAVIVTSALTEDFAALFSERIDFTETVSADSFDWNAIDTSRAVSGNAVSYIIYTSGTTGLPKGVAVSHDNLQSFTRWMNQDFEQIANNQFLEQPLYSFDLSIFSLYPSLAQGGTLHALSREETTNFKWLFERLNRTLLNTWVSTPSFVDICLLDPSFVQAQHPELRQFIFCGEELTHRTAEKLLVAFPEASIYNTYGPTEATGAVSQIKVNENLLKSYKRVPLGFAKPGVELRMIDEEIVIVGDSVAAGYFENPTKTAAAFFELDGKPAYHTGDAGFIDDAGVLNYKGRLDFQVKFNGFRIELQDIEAHLLALAQVKKALVLAQENEAHKVTALVAVLVVEAEKPDRVFTKHLKQELSSLIMDYMMPTRFVYVTDFPLTQNGKIDRKALAAEVLS
jgi:D-alanine--poly(phosphoribitol) ligase subunit 1